MHPDTFPSNPNKVGDLDNTVGVQGTTTPDTGIAAEADLAIAAERDAELEDTAPDQVLRAAQAQAQQSQSREGKLVFKPNELNQSGEDKEYFHPNKDHKFDAPKDANDHALKPDIEVTPDNTVKVIR